MTLAELLQDTVESAALDPAIASVPVSGLDYDSRRVSAGQVFFAFQGARADGRQFALDAIRKGAVAVVSELTAPETFTGAWIQVPFGRRTLAMASRRFYPNAAGVLITGITGTNGKTTTSYLIDSILRAAGKVTAVIGTIEYRIAGERLPAVNTTPESLDIYRLLEELSAKGGTHATIEISSHALDLGRAWGLRCHTAVFTNLTQDHLDYHGSLNAYFEAKSKLFEAQGGPPPDHAAINFDDNWGRQIRLSTGTQAWWYGLSPAAGVRAQQISNTFDGLQFEVVHDGGVLNLKSPLAGTINVYNILAACAAGLSYRIPSGVIETGIAQCESVPGRFERVAEGQPFLVVVDYAHTPDALKNVIEIARALQPSRVITLFGCGGDRDRTKRPLMGSAAAEASDYVVLTSDNPRSEDPLTILNDARVGIDKFNTPYHVEPDRESAIRHAILRAQPGDVVILAGKGHENYQILKDRTIPFDDREVARRVLRGVGS